MAHWNSTAALRFMVGPSQHSSSTVQVYPIAAEKSASRLESREPAVLKNWRCVYKDLSEEVY